MQKWLVKAAVQRALGFAPGGARLHEWAQTHVTKSIRLSRADFEDHLRRDAAHLRYWREATGRAGVPRAALEVGTGWHPILPLALVLCGVERVDTYDVAAHLAPARNADTVGEFLAAADDGRLYDLLPDARPERVERLRAEATTPGDPLPRLGIFARVADGRFADVPDASADLIVSNVALEYVGGAALDRMLAEFARALAPGGAMSHDICLMDQYAAFDGRLPKLNFLRYGDAAWRVINNPFIPLARLRASDYTAAFARAGFAVELRDVRAVTREELDRVPLAARFRRYDADDLRVLRAVWVCRR